MIRVHDILAGTHGRLFGSISRNDLLARVVHDSRDVDKGDLFIALKGERTDGHRFVPDALEAGAGAVMVDESWFRRFDLGDLPVIVVPDTLVALQSLAAYWRSLFSEARVIGITGSIGKSSTKEVISAVLAQRYEVTRSRKSFNNEIGHLAQIARPTIGVVTNVSHSHLGRMGSLDAIAKTKTELVEALPADGLAVLNIDDRRVRAMAERAKCRVVYYGTDPAADYYATELESHGIEGISFTLHHGDVQSYVSVPLMGRHSVHMALVGVAIGTELGLSLADILRGFQAPDIQLRLLLLPGVNGSTVLDDSYNANPASCVAALNLLAELDATRRVAVFGDMYELGTYEEEGHRRVGGRAAETVDALYTMGPLARLIAAEAVKARPDLPVEMFDDKRALEDALRRDLRPGDLVLIKGSRGLELETLVSALRNQMAEETD